jgi:hypothetical protein
MIGTDDEGIENAIHYKLNTTIKLLFEIITKDLTMT